MHPQPAGGICDLRQIENEGLGLFAKVDIPEGTIISDEITVKIQTGPYKPSAATWQDPEFWEIYRTCGAANVEQAISDHIAYYKDDTFQHALFDRLSRSISGEGLSDRANIVFSNCLPTKSKSSPFSVLFGITTCAFNHACIPNAKFIGINLPDDTSKIRYQVVAIEFFKANIEITVSYMISNLPTAQRRLQIGHIPFRLRL